MQMNMNQMESLPRQDHYILPDGEIQEFDKVHITYDYGLFDLIQTNRNLNAKNRARIMKSCQKQQLVRPINVSIHDGKLLIVDGQHRFSVWKELEQPIYFIINPDYSEFEMKEMNLSGMIWNKTTFLESYVKAEKEPYVIFKSLLEKTGFTIDLLLSIFNHFQIMDLEQIHETFKEGKLTLNALDEIEAFIFFYKNFATYSHHKKTNFVKSLIHVYDHNDVDKEHLLKQYQKHHQHLKVIRGGSIRKYVGTLMNDIYSTQTSQTKSLYFNVEKGRFHR